MPAELTEANVRELGGRSQAEHEEALLRQMQTLSEMLAKVNTTLDDCPSTAVPSTAGSQRPPPSRERCPTGGRPATGERPASGQRPATGPRLTGGGRTAAEDRPHAPRSATSAHAHEPEVVSLAELNERDAPVPLVQYTGSQSQLAGISSRRRVDARAAKSEIGSVLSWGGDDSQGYFLKRTVER